MADDFEELDYDKISAIIDKRDAQEKVAKKKKRDAITIIMAVLSFGALAMLIAAWVAIEYASPEREMKFMTSFFSVHFGTPTSIRLRWNNSLVYLAYVFMLISLGMSLIAFVLNTLGMKRVGKKSKISVFLLGGVAVVAFFFFMLNFWSVVFR